MTHTDIVVAGHICLDVIPTFPEHTGKFETLLVPGKLVNVDPAVIATGGTVSNTGLTLHRLGIPTTLMGKIGKDAFGEAVLHYLRTHADSLTGGMILADDEPTSYSIVISPPGVDRIFLHCPGANDSFCADDVDMATLEGTKLFHFGYPPLMRQMYLNEGAESLRLLQRVKNGGITTSLDMAYPDPDSEAGQVDWERVLGKVLPYVDVFLPSFDEILFMLDRPRFQAYQENEESALAIDAELLSVLTGRLLDMGAAIVGLKLGSQGFYLRTTPSVERLRRMGANTPPDLSGWIGRELLAPCFQANLVGTTGAGDCTIAGFLAGFLQQQSVEQAMISAVAVGGFNVESADATTGIPDWETVQTRIRNGWNQHQSPLPKDRWRWEHTHSLWFGSHDNIW